MILLAPDASEMPEPGRRLTLDELAFNEKAAPAGVGPMIVMAGFVES